MRQLRRQRDYAGFGAGHSLAITMATRLSNTPGTPLDKLIASHGAQWNIGSTPFTINASPSSEVIGDVKPSTAAVMTARFVDQRRHDRAQRDRNAKAERSEAVGGAVIDEDHQEVTGRIRTLRRDR